MTATMDSTKKRNGKIMNLQRRETFLKILFFALIIAGMALNVVMVTMSSLTFSALMVYNDFGIFVKLWSEYHIFSLVPSLLAVSGVAGLILFTRMISF